MFRVGQAPVGPVVPLSPDSCPSFPLPVQAVTGRVLHNRVRFSHMSGRTGEGRWVEDKETEKEKKKE